MTESQVCVDYLSTGANRQTAVADWSSSGILAFGADSNIGLWTPSSTTPEGITALLSGHTETVKAVKFLCPVTQDGASFIVSGSDDKSLKLWSVSPDARSAECVQTISQEHTSPINCLAALEPRKPSTTVLLASGAADATVKIWSFGPSSRRLQLVQTIKPSPKYFPLALALTCLDQDEDVFVLAAAGTKDIVQIFVAGGGEHQTVPAFELQATLTGHEGWIRCLDFVWEDAAAGSDLLLASSSQDKYIRIWRFRQGKDLPSPVANSDPSSGAFLPGKSPANKVHRLHAAGKVFSANFEALLLGHEDWIYSAKWFATAEENGNTKLQLLSTSADNSLAMWEADPASGIWLSMVRLGEISREKGATTATGSIGGFWTGLWAPDGKSVVCLGRTGSWRRWVLDEVSDQWLPAASIGGHTKAVTGMAWSRDGAHLLSTGSDQTTRLHAQWRKNGGGRVTWHEMCRPQIHGYDLNCIDVLGTSQFVSGADEKLMRVFSKPRAVARLLDRLGGSGSGPSDNDSNEHPDASDMVPDAANMPVLGLSNKAIEAVVDDDFELQPGDPQDRDSVDPASVVRKSALDMDHPPFEESLSRHTLWPEAEKLYGHGYELSCLAASHDGRLIASACKASSVNHAVVRLFETERWTEVKPPLAAHSLTATRLRFSADDKYLLSVGRDRQWAVFERGGGDGDGDDDNTKQPYRLLQANPKGHTRMILDAAWAPLGSETDDGSRVFATAGRDKRVRIWSGKTQEAGGKLKFAQAAEITFDGPVTAVDFLGRTIPGGALVLAVGTEAGKLTVYSLAPDTNTLQVAVTLQVPLELCLPKPVLQLAWRPPLAAAEETEGRQCELAIAGEDSSVRIYRFSLGLLETSGGACG